MCNSKRNLILLVLFVAVVSAGVGFAVAVSRRLFEAHERFSIVWQTHDMLTRCIMDRGGELPRNWDDLEHYFDETNAGYGTPSFDWLRERIEVDFDFDPDSVVSTEQVADNSIRVLRLTGAVENRETREANQRLRTLMRSYRN